MATLSFLVLRARDIEATVAFYETLGLKFSPEQHGGGPPHFACEQDGWVLEVYPLKAGQTEVTDSVMLGFRVPSLEAVLESLRAEVEIKIGKTRVCSLLDPDGRTVRLEER